MNQVTVLKKGTRVEFVYKGQMLLGVVEKGGSKKATVILDGGEKCLTGPASAFHPTAAPMPKDPPSPMDRYSVIDFKGHEDMSDETLCFSARICLNRIPIMHVSNQGCGGPHMYQLLIKGSAKDMENFFKHAKAWCIQFGYKNPMEAGDFWVDWYTIKRPYAVTAEKYVGDFAKYIAAL
jgi:hypothetical protein